MLAEFKEVCRVHKIFLASSMLIGNHVHVYFHTYLNKCASAL